MTPDLEPYFALMTALSSRRLTPSEFQAILVRLFKEDQMMRPPEIYDQLNKMFLAAEAYRPRGAALDDYAVNADELYEVADAVQRKLREITAGRIL